MDAEETDFAQRLLAWRKRLQLKQPQAAKVLGIGKTYYSRLENGRKAPGRFLLEKFNLIEHEPETMIRDVLSEKSARVREEARENHGMRSKPSIYNESRRLQVRKIPLIGWAQAGAAVDFKAVVDWDDFVSAEINDPKAIAVRIRGDSMAPRYVAGDIAILACSDQAKSDDLVIAKLLDEGVVFKKLQIVDPHKQLFRFISFNEQYAPLDRSAEQIVWIYPVDSVIQKLRR